MIVRVPWNPVAKERPRSTKSGVIYTPKRTKEAEKAFADAFKDEVGDDFVPFDDVIAVHFTFHKDHTIVSIDQPRLPVKRTLRGDLDNYIKTVSDALNGIAWVDDRQIGYLSARDCDA